MVHYDDIPDLVRKERKKKGLSLRQAGFQLNCNSTKLCDIECRLVPVTIGFAKKVENAWGLEGLTRAVRFEKACEFIKSNEVQDFIEYIGEI